MYNVYYVIKIIKIKNALNFHSSVLYRALTLPPTMLRPRPVLGSRLRMTFRSGPQFFFLLPPPLWSIWVTVIVKLSDRVYQSSPRLLNVDFCIILPMTLLAGNDSRI